MRRLATAIALLSLATAQSALASPDGAPDRTLDGLARWGLDLGGPGAASVALHLASGRELTGSLGPAGNQTGGQGAGMFVASRYDLTGPVDRIATASLTLTSYPAQQVTVAALDYDGPALAARDAIALRLHLPGYSRGMAIHPVAPGYAAPIWASDYRSLPSSNLMLLWQRSHRVEYQLLAPLAGGGMVGSVGVRGYRFGVTMSADATTLGRHVPLFVFATGLSPYQLARKAYRIAFRDAGFHGRLRWEKGYPDAFTRLGWSSAPAYADVTAADAVDAARSFRSRGLPLGFVLLDDGWLTVNDGRLAGFEASRSRFPGGLPGLVRKLRIALKVRDVGVWHPLAGYLNGVDPRSAIGKAHSLLAANHGAYLPDPQGDANFFDAWYTLLGREGVDFVKVDDQGDLASLTSGVMPLFDAGQGELRNLEAAAVRHFGRLGGVNMLCGGGLALEAAYNWHYADLARVSEPLRPGTAETAKDRILQDVFDSYWLSSFAYPDYGSFRSAAPESRYEAIAHAIKTRFFRDDSVAQKQTETSLIERFMYPKLGPGQMWQEAARIVTERGGEIHLRHRVVGLNCGPSGGAALPDGTGPIEVTVQDLESGRTFTQVADYVFSTMPIKDLVEALGPGVPADVQRVAGGLLYRDFITCGVLLRRLELINQTAIPTINDLVPDNWIYVQEPEVKVGRLQIFNNWSPYLVADPDTVWVGMEYFCNEGDELWSMPAEDFARFAIDELARIDIIDPADVLDSTVHRIPKAYPAYFGSYDEFAVLRSWLDRFENLFLIGRNGMHKYNNQDHSMLTAMVAVDNILAGIRTKDNLWEVNTEAEYHEVKERRIASAALEPDGQPAGSAR